MARKQDIEEEADQTEEEEEDDGAVVEATSSDGGNIFKRKKVQKEMPIQVVSESELTQLKLNKILELLEKLMLIASQ